jgi:hypothetical protein
VQCRLIGGQQLVKRDVEFNSGGSNSIRAVEISGFILLELV